jgi:tRNA(Ile)-lysidine synthetase-like protein
LELPRQNTPLVFTRISDGTTRAGDWEIFSESCTYAGQEQGKLEFWLRAEELDLRSRMTGDELKLPNRPGKSVKKWLVEEKIPRRYRENLPVFTAGGRLCAVAGLGADERFLPALGEKARHLKLIPPGEKRDEKGMQLHADE